MATTREIRRRIRSIRNISQVTRAMEMVSASKMMRAQTQVISSRPYSDKAWRILTHLACVPTSDQLHPLMEQRPIDRVGLVLITSDRGLCGGLNSNLIRRVARFVQGEKRPVRAIAIGKKGRDALARVGVEIVAEFAKLPDPPTLLDITPVARVAIDEFLAGGVDQVYVGYTDFINTLTQEPTIRMLLPVAIACGIDEVGPGREHIYEPDSGSLLSELLPRFLEAQIYIAVMESLASEHSARMVAMRNATENANEMVTDLTLQFNQARQSLITREMLEIAAGAASLERARQKESQRATQQPA